MNNYRSQQNSNNNSLKCDVCNIVFTTPQEKEQHIKLEHKKEQEPTDVQ